MHDRRCCLCPDCVRVAVTEDEEVRVCAKLVEMSPRVKHAKVVRLADGLVRRRAA